jgi:hypothetical protein
MDWHSWSVPTRAYQGLATWKDVDPARHPFDSASAEAVVYSLEPSRHVPHLPEGAHDPRTWDDALIRRLNEWESREAHPWVAAMSYALAERYGRWTFGWCWAQGEGECDGGPIKTWFSARRSIGTPQNTPATVAAALCEWREWLESLARWFESYPLNPSTSVDRQLTWRRAARDLIMHVIERTECLSGWHAHCRQVLTWFLERWGVDPYLAVTLVDAAIGGRFESWTDPDPALVDNVVEGLTESIPLAGGVRETAVEPDDLQRWLEVRDQVKWKPARSHGGVGRDQPPIRDGAVQYIGVFDAAIDPARAQGLLDALELMRAEAAQHTPLSFEVLRRWQQHVLGVRMPPFRIHPAFAKGGRERYGIGPETPGRFDACLAQSAFDPDHPLSVSIRAARVYLDVCFFHPFDDGNARSAFLASLFVLARERIVLESVETLRWFSLYAADPEDAAWLARDIETSTLIRNGMYTGD